jgi:Asp-tRNA(Asn)/Glu-tRNA(Gln) amidotransferase A subunit family amidase
LFEGEEASCVKRLRDAGAIVAGKTVTTEFAGIAPGPTRNPLNPDHTPGGSSSGSAAGVAAGFFPLALGTQTTGSVIRPAAYCGVVGFKPSLGRISTDGVIPFSFSTDHVGIFVPETGLIDRVMPVLADGWESAPFSPCLGIPDGPYLDKTSPEAFDHFETVVNRVEKSGFSVQRIPLFDDLEAIHRRHRRLVTGEITRVHREWNQQYAERYRSRTREYFVMGKDVSENELKQLREKQLDLRNQIHRQMENHGIDAWICPSATGTAPRGISSTGDPIMNMPWTNAGLPAITIPCGTDGAGLPYGLQIVGKFMEDEKAAAIAGGLEKIDYDIP